MVLIAHTKDNSTVVDADHTRVLLQYVVHLKLEGVLAHFGTKRHCLLSEVASVDDKHCQRL